MFVSPTLTLSFARDTFFSLPSPFFPVLRQFVNVLWKKKETRKISTFEEKE